MTRISLLVLFSVGVFAACSRDERRAPVARDVAVRPVPSAATQTELAHEIDDAERRGTWREVRDRWQGQRLRWTVTRQRLLCQSAQSCNVAAFPIQRPALHGWMPRLELTAAEHAKIEQGCGRAEQCELVFEGTLRELALSPELPTSMRFTDVSVVAAKTGDGASQRTLASGV